MKLNNDSNQGWRNSPVRKKFYHSETFNYPDTIHEGTATTKNEEDKASNYAFVVPWQMD